MYSHYWFTQIKTMNFTTKRRFESLCTKVSNSGNGVLVKFVEINMSHIIYNFHRFNHQTSFDLTMQTNHRKQTSIKHAFCYLDPINRCRCFPSCIWIPLFSFHVQEVTRPSSGLGSYDSLKHSCSIFGKGTDLKL